MNIPKPTDLPRPTQGDSYYVGKEHVSDSTGSAETEATLEEAILERADIISAEGLSAVIDKDIEAEPHTLAEVKAILRTDKVIETATSFIVFEHGKYKPNISFVLPKNFNGNPLKYRKDEPTLAMVRDFGLEFGTPESDISILFGDFWKSKANKPHFKPSSSQVATHVIVRAAWGGPDHPRTRGAWKAPEDVTHFRRAASNGGGVGYDYYVLPIGYKHIINDKEIDGDITGKQASLEERAAAIRAAFYEYDKNLEDKAKAAEEAKIQAERESQAARLALMPHLLSLQEQLEELKKRNPRTIYGDFAFGDTYFRFGWNNYLYSEENVTHVEDSIKQSEARYENDIRAKEAMDKFKPLFEQEEPRLQQFEYALTFYDIKVVVQDGRYYPSYPYTAEGLSAFIAYIEKKEVELAEKSRIEAAKRTKLEAEAGAAELGLPQNVQIWHRGGGVTNRGNGWVVRPDGTIREHDQMDGNPRTIRNKGDGFLVWNQILPGELVLKYYQSDRYDIPHCEVVYRPDAITKEQLLVAKQIEEDKGAIENAFGLDIRIGELIERRIGAIELAMQSLPAALNPESGWDYQVLASNNGIMVASGESWVNINDQFDDKCEGREAQIVYTLPAADGELVALAYYKWGGWNINLVWRESDSMNHEIVSDMTEAVRPIADHDEDGEPTEHSLKDLIERFGKY